MARVRDQHLGTIQGQVGPQVFKVLNGDSYVAQLPHRSNVEPSDAVKNQRKRFGLVMKLTKGIYVMGITKPFWKDVTIEGSTKVLTISTKIAKTNFSNVTPTEVLDTATLVPDFGFAVDTTNITLANDGISATTAALSDTGIINTAIEKFIALGCVLHLSEPTITSAPSHRFLSLASSKINLNTSNPLTFNLVLDSSMGQIFDLYQTKKAFFVLVTYDINNVPVHFSSTFHSV